MSMLPKRKLKLRGKLQRRKQGVVTDVVCQSSFIPVEKAGQKRKEQRASLIGCCLCNLVA